MEGSDQCRSSRIKSKDDTEEKVMRVLRKPNVISGMAFTEDLAMVGGTDESYENHNRFEEA